MLKYLLVAAALAAGPVEAQTLALKGPGVTRTLTAADIAALPHVGVVMDDHGEKVSFEGVPLRALATLAGAPEGEAVRGPQLTSTILISASDGYRVVVSVGEIEPTLGKAKAVLADRQNGKPLGEGQGPFRLVIEGDGRPARSARNVIGVTVSGPMAP